MKLEVQNLMSRQLLSHSTNAPTNINGGGASGAASALELAGNDHVRRHHRLGIWVTAGNWLGVR